MDNMQGIPWRSGPCQHKTDMQEQKDMPFLINVLPKGIQNLENFQVQFLSVNMSVLQIMDQGIVRRLRLLQRLASNEDRSGVSPATITVYCWQVVKHMPAVLQHRNNLQCEQSLNKDVPIYSGQRELQPLGNQSWQSKKAVHMLMKLGHDETRYIWRTCYRTLYVVGLGNIKRKTIIALNFSITVLPTTNTEDTISTLL